jgi:patatin-related protein
MTQSAGRDPKPISAQRAVDPDDLEEVRLAVVMNGGVSLAVWIAGVTNEINQLQQQPPDRTKGPYGALLEIVQSTARVDVISGASAGGINGAFLALATVYGTSLSELGVLWARRAALADLLRSPFAKNPPSLLQGERFLEQLHDSFADVFPKDHETRYRPPRQAPVDLTVTVSMIQGEPVPFVDDYGTPMTQANHRGRIQFVRTEWTSEEEDPFRSPTLVRQLALAARSTASFPGAFEPSLIPVGISAGESHPDMSGIARFASTRYVLDGGILMNQPMQPALQAIADQPASRQVRRILVYVNPDPQLKEESDSDGSSADPPALRKVITDSLVTLPAVQSIRPELEEIQRQNRRARDRRLSRIDLIEFLGSDDVIQLALRLFDSYKAVRKRRAINGIAEQVSLGLAAAGRVTVAPGSREKPPSWTRMEIEEAFKEARFDLIPERFPVNSKATLQTRYWGISTVERLCAVAVDILRRAIWLVPLTDPLTRKELRVARQQLHDLISSVRGFRNDDKRFWRAEGTSAAGIPSPPTDSSKRTELLQTWADDALRRWPLLRLGEGARSRSVQEEREFLLSGLEHVTLAVIGLIVTSEPHLRWAVRAGMDSQKPDLVIEAGRLASVVDLVFGGIDATGSDGLSGHDQAVPLPVWRSLERLLALEVCQLTLSGDDQVLEQEVELIQISGDGDSSFTPWMTARDKLAGAQLGHFGAFYKESWRVSDWTWGRIDGATRLCLAILSPQRLRWLRYGTEEALAAIRRVAVEEANDADRLELAREFPEQACRDELTYLDEETWPVPPSLPACAMAVARRIHLDVLRDELPRLSSAVSNDTDAGANRHGAGPNFARAYDAHVKNGSPLEASVAFNLFKSAGIGSERVTAEFGSDLLARTLSSAVAVGVGAAQAGTSGFGIVRPIFRALRGFTLALHALVWNAVSGSAIGVTAVNFALAVGGAALAIALLIQDAPPLIGAVGVMLVLAGIGLAALRARMDLFAFVLALMAVGVAALSIWVLGDRETFLGQLRTVGAIVGVVLAAMLLGSIGTRRSN